MATTITGTTIDVGTNVIVTDSAGNVGIGISSPASSVGSCVDATGPLLVGGHINSHQTNKSVIENNSNNMKLRAYGATSGTGYMTFHTGGGGDAADSEAMRINSAGIVTKPLQPAFSVDASEQLNFPINTVVTVPFDVEVFDVGANFNTSTKTFTAPITGKYHLNVTVHMRGIDSAANYYEAVLNTSNRVYSNFTDGEGGTDPDTYTLTISQLCDMDLGDTAYVTINQSGGAAQTDLRQGCHFSGYLAL